MESWHPVRWSKLAISCNFPLQQKNALAESGESCCPTSLQPQSLHWPTSPLLMLPGWLTTSAIQTGKLANKQYKTKRNTHTHTHKHTHKALCSKLILGLKVSGCTLHATIRSKTLWVEACWWAPEIEFAAFRIVLICLAPSAVDQFCGGLKI